VVVHSIQYRSFEEVEVRVLPEDDNRRWYLGNPVAKGKGHNRIAARDLHCAQEQLHRSERGKVGVLGLARGMKQLG
jgi:hypothetical protein